MNNNPETHQVSTIKAPETPSKSKIHTMAGSIAAAAMVLLTACTISSYRSTSEGHNKLRINDDISGCSNDDEVRRRFQKDCDPKTVREFYSNSLKCFSCKMAKKAPDIYVKPPHVRPRPLKPAPDISIKSPVLKPRKPLPPAPDISAAKPPRDEKPPKSPSVKDVPSPDDKRSKKRKPKSGLGRFLQPLIDRM